MSETAHKTPKRRPVLVQDSLIAAPLSIARGVDARPSQGAARPCAGVALAVCAAGEQSKRAGKASDQRAMYARHNTLRDSLAAEFNRAGVPTKLEEPLPDGSSRSDIQLLEPSEIAPEHIDVFAVHPLHHSASPAETAPG